MASLKELRARIGSIKSTRKITSAMKMVAAAKLRRAQASAEAARPYAAAMRRMLAELAGAAKGKKAVHAFWPEQGVIRSICLFRSPVIAGCAVASTPTCTA